MINYIRTGLWNRPAQTVTSFRGCDLFIPANFRPIVDDPLVQGFRETLFGKRPDYPFLLYRTHILLSLLHTSYYRRYVYDWDNRLTYDMQEPLLTRLFVTDIQSFGGAVQLEGLPSVNEELGLCSTNLVVQAALNSVEVAVRETSQITATLLPRSTVLPVPGTKMRINIPPHIAVSANIYAANRPERNCADVVLDVNHSHAKNVAKHVFATGHDGVLAELRAAYYGESDATEQFALLCFAAARYTILRSEGAA